MDEVGNRAETGSGDFDALWMMDDTCRRHKKRGTGKKRRRKKEGTCTPSSWTNGLRKMSEETIMNLPAEMCWLLHDGPSSDRLSMVLYRTALPCAALTCPGIVQLSRGPLTPTPKPPAHTQRTSWVGAAVARNSVRGSSTRPDHGLGVDGTWDRHSGSRRAQSTCYMGSCPSASARTFSSQ